MSRVATEPSTQAAGSGAMENLAMLGQSNRGGRTHDRVPLGALAAGHGDHPRELPAFTGHC
jgi:hypothetical protein